MSGAISGGVQGGLGAYEKRKSIVGKCLEGRVLPSTKQLRPALKSLSEQGANQSTRSITLVERTHYSFNLKLIHTTIF